MNKTIAIFTLAAVVTSAAVPARASTFTISGSGSLFTIQRSGVTVDGTDVGLLAGPGWTYDADVKQLTISADCTLSGTNDAGAVSVLVSADCTVTLSNLCLRCTEAYTAYAPVLLDATANVAATLVLAGDNTLRALQSRAGIGVPPGTSLTVTGDGRLDVAGGYMSAGIGGCLTTGCGSVSIEGGIITIGRGTEAACIGGGSYGAGGDVAISGGTILLREYTSAPIPNSIGGGHYSSGNSGTLTITGGSLGEIGSSGTRALDLSLLGSAPTNAAGEALSCVAITNQIPGGAVVFKGLPAYYGTDGIVADANGNIFLWLPAGDWSGIVTDIVYPAYLDGADDTVKANYVAWATSYGANTNAEYEGHFLLGISPATTIPEGGALLKVVQFNATARSFHIEIGSDVPGYRFFQPKDADGEDDPTLLGNGYAVLELAMDLPAFAPNQTIPQIVRMPVPVAINATTGHATVDFDLGEFLAQLYPEVPQEWRDEVTMPSPLFLRPAITTTYPDDYMDFLYLLVAEP